MAILYYPQFAVATVDTDGFRQMSAAEDIDFYNITQDTLIDTLTTDADGLLGPGSFDSASFPVALGDTVELRHATLPGKARFILTDSAEAAVLAVENHVTTLILDYEYDDETPDQAAIFVKDTANPNAAPRFVGNVPLGVATPLPLRIVEGQTVEVVAVKQQKDFQFHGADLDELPSIELNVFGASGDSPPSFGSVAYDTPNSEVDLTFVKVGSATGNIQVEYKVAGGSVWTTHGTEFAHGATSGSIVITEQPSPVTYDIRLKQAGVSGYSVTRQVTVDASGGGGTPPSNLFAYETALPGGPPSEYEVTLTWTAGSGSGNYTVERKTGTGGTWSAITTSEATTGYADHTIFGLQTSKTYYYRVSQNDVTGYSNEAWVYIPRDSGF